MKTAEQAINSNSGVHAPDVFSAPCPSRQVLKHVCSRWGVLILIALRDGTHRFSELRRRLDGVSEKMLAQTLQLLADDGFVDRKSYPVVPPFVEYSLTPMGEEIAERVADITGWIEENLMRVMEVRENAKLAILG